MQSTITELLAVRGIDVRNTSIRLMRHTSKEYPDMTKHIGTKALTLYQSVQNHPYKEGSYIIGFYGHRPGYAILLGIWRIESHMDADAARDLGLLEGTFENLEAIGGCYHQLTELDLLDDLFLTLEIEWGKELAWNRNLKAGQIYPINFLDQCPITLDTLPESAVEKLEDARRIRQSRKIASLDEETVLRTLLNNTEFLSLPETTRTAIIQARIGQGEFRDDLISYWQGCAVTNCTLTEALIASHIVPWKIADNQGRRDPFNGLLLTPNLDKLFDKHLISFDEQGEILISKTLNKSVLRALGVTQEMKLRKLHTNHIPYLGRHREKFLSNEAAVGWAEKPNIECNKSVRDTEDRTIKH